MSLTLTYSVHIRVCHQLSFPCSCFCTTKHVLVISYTAAKCVSAWRCSLLDRLGDLGWIRRTLCFVTQSEKVKGPLQITRLRWSWSGGSVPPRFQRASQSAVHSQTRWTKLTFGPNPIQICASEHVPTQETQITAAFSEFCSSFLPFIPTPAGWWHVSMSTAALEQCVSLFSAQHPAFFLSWLSVQTVGFIKFPQILNCDEVIEAQRYSRGSDTMTQTGLTRPNISVPDDKKEINGKMASLWARTIGIFLNWLIWIVLFLQPFRWFSINLLF